MPRYIPQKVDGVVLLDKPGGISSQTAVTTVKTAFLAAKAGHTGTLDPLATGLLPVCLGEATKYSQDLLNADKSYVATILFGAKTDTGDSEGKVIAQGQVDFNTEDQATVIAKLEALLPQFSGRIQQVPPMYSALKREGKPLYEYARAGQTLEIEARTVSIYDIRWVSIAWPVATIELTCSKGTYIRSIANDMGEVLGCGAHLTALRRTRVGHLDIKNAVPLESIKNQQVKLFPVDMLVQTLPKIILDPDLAQRLSLGQRVPIQVEDLSEGLIRVYQEHESPESFMGTVELQNGVLHPKRLMAQVQPNNLSTHSSGFASVNAQKTSLAIH
jgi:tRNA pseudouridine55 synthase